MATQDRRSGDERRITGRHTIELNVEWEGSGTRMPGTLSDISFEGCFVLSSGDVVDGEKVRIFVPLADGMSVAYVGTVANHVVEIGFGVKFDELYTAQKDLLNSILKDLKKT